MEPYIQICKTGPAKASAGTDIQYMLSPTSTVDEDAELVGRDTLPAGETLVGTPSGAGWDCSTSTSTQVTCFVDNTDFGDAITVTVHIASNFAGDSLHNLRRNPARDHRDRAGGLLGHDGDAGG